MKKAFILFRIIGGAMGASGILYAAYYNNKMRYLFSAIGFLMLTFFAIINNRSVAAKQ
ncbi:MAG: hypothetical protein WCG87_04935 [Bacteroidota bacterium]